MMWGILIGAAIIGVAWRVVPWWLNKMGKPGDAP